MACADDNVPTTNPAWGFFGTVGGEASADTAWPLTMAAIVKATGCTSGEVRAFLDSRHGRHFADELHNEMHAGKTLQDAITAATATWMGWKITTRIARDTGIPRGLPYLTGFMIDAGIAADGQA
jgi:hypothetical protein